MRSFGRTLVFMIYTRLASLRLRQPVSGLSHLGGAFAAAVGLCSLLASRHAMRTPWHLMSFAVFGVTMVLLYLASSLYHLLPLSERGVAVLRRIDHMMIYVFIAGTYTPFCLVALRNGTGLGMAAAVWAVAGAGVLLKMFWLETSRWVRVLPYLLMSALSVLILPELFRVLPGRGCTWLVGGAAIYGIGAVVYATKRPDPLPEVLGFHEIWHFFVLGGSFCHFWVVSEYVALL